jgi:hypothetical protein
MSAPAPIFDLEASTNSLIPWWPACGRPHPIQLRPWLDELSILTKDLTVARLGDVMSLPQVELVEQCQRQLDLTGQIRQVVLKARQMGFSTIIEGIGFVLAMRVANLQGRILSHRGDSAEGILTMMKRYWQTYPFRFFHVEQYAGKKQLSWADRGSNIQVMTAGSKESGRSSTIQFLHASEVAFWIGAEQLMTGLRQAIPQFGLTAIFLESTANGVGNYFHQQYTLAKKGRSEFQAMFFPWHRHPEYTAKFLPASERAKFNLDDLDEEERSLVNTYRVTVGQLLWRRWAIVNLCQGDIERFHQEFPSNDNEAFVSTGRNVFQLPLIVAHADLELGRTGHLTRERGGKIRFVETKDGPLTIFRPPSPDKEWGVYLIGADPTHTTVGDNACAQVLNRRTLEQVAVFRRKTDPITFAKELDMLGNFYNEALIAPEKTGPGYATVGALVATNYPRLYMPVDIASTQGIPKNDIAGWVTNTQTKHLAINHLLRALKDPLAQVGGMTYGLVIHDVQTATEMRDYVTTEDGKGYVNSDGSEFDDGVMALAIAITVHNIEPAVGPYQPRASHELPANVANQPATPRMQSGASNLTTPTKDELEDDSSSESYEAPWESWGNKEQ